MRRVSLIYNPITGRCHRRRFAATHERLRQLGCEVDVLETERAGDAERLASAISPTDCDVIAVAGGGTINEVVNGLHPDSPPFAIVPLGTANVLACEISLQPAPDTVASVIAHGTPRPIYVGAANGRRFVQMAGVRFDAHIVAGIDPGLKRRLGRAAHGAEIAQHWWLRRPLRCAVTVDSSATRGAWWWWRMDGTTAGPFVLSPDASLWRPELRVCLCLGNGRWAVATYVMAHGAGLLPRRADVAQIPARTLDIEGAAGEHVQLDGDVRTTLPCRIEALPRLYRILAPRSRAEGAHIELSS